MPPSTDTIGSSTQVDVRGPRFAAWVTTALLVITLISSAVSALTAAVILSAQAVVFAIGALRDPTAPLRPVFANLVAPRLGPVTQREPVPPLKFAQLVGFVFAVAGVIGSPRRSAAGLDATAFALVAAFLTAFGICLGCQLYPLVARLGETQAVRCPPPPNTKQPKGFRPWHAPTSWSQSTGPRAISKRRTPSSSRSTRTPPPTTAATSPAPSSWTGARSAGPGRARLRRRRAVLEAAQ